MRSFLRRVLAYVIVMGMIVGESSMAVYASPISEDADILGESEIDASEESVDEESVDEGSVDEESDEDAVGEDTVSEDTVSEDTVSEDAVREEAEDENVLMPNEHNCNAPESEWLPGISKRAYTLEDGAKLMEDIPASFRSSYISEVRNQGTSELCWSFASVANAETSYLREREENPEKYAADFNGSEVHLARFSVDEGVNYYDPAKPETELLAGDHGRMDGRKLYFRSGSAYDASFALARWTGVADESEDASLAFETYRDVKRSNSKDIEIEDKYAFRDTMHLKNAAFVNLRDIDNAKRAVMENGIFAMPYSHKDGFYDEKLNAYYYDEQYRKQFGWSGHYVSVVGWDDDFDFSEFNPSWAAANGDYGVLKPANNGAWLCKNSWGKDWGDDGFFWISYYDACINGPEVYNLGFVLDFTGADNYDHNYQYDGGTDVVTYNLNRNTFKAGAVYSAYTDQTLEAVSVAIGSVDTDVTVKIYKNPEEGNDPETGELEEEATTTKQFALPGIYTIPLKKSVSLDANERFAIVVTAKVEEGKKASMFVDKAEYGCEVAVNPGETFFYDGYEWRDAEQAENMTIRIKAFTNDAGSGKKHFDAVTVADLGNVEFCLDAGDDPYETLKKNIASQIEVYYDYEKVDSELYHVNYVGEGESDSYLFPGPHEVEIVCDGNDEFEGGTVTKSYTITAKPLTSDMLQLLGNDPTGKVIRYTGDKLEDKIALKDDVSKAELNSSWYTLDLAGKSFVNSGAYNVVIKAAENAPYCGSIKAAVKINKNTLAGTTTDKEGEGDSDFYIKAISGMENDFTGAPVKPSFEIRNRVTDSLIPASNYTITYKNNINAYESGSLIPTVVISGKGSLEGQTSFSFDIAPKELHASDVTVTTTPLTYTGKALAVKAVVKLGNKALSEGKDYVFEDAEGLKLSPVDAGQYPALIRFINNYTGNVSTQFEVKPAPAKAAKITATLNRDKKTVDAYYDNITLPDTDQDPEADADEYDYELTDAQDPANPIVDIGDIEAGHKYNLTIVLKGNYSGQKLFKNLYAVSDISAADVSVIGSYTYTGSAIKPRVEVRLDDALIPTKEYTVVYGNNINRYTEEIAEFDADAPTITIIGKGNYSGTKAVNFNIAKKTVSVSTLPSSYTLTYTGTDLTGALVSKIKVKGLKAGDYSINVKENEEDESNVDAIVSAGTYFGSIDLLNNNYILDSGTSKKFEVSVLPAQITSVKADNGFFKGTGTPVEPKVTVLAGKLGLIEGRDYNCSYSNNEDLTTALNKAQVTVLLASDNFVFKNDAQKTVKFAISKASLAKSQLVLPEDENAVYGASPWEYSTLKIVGDGGNVVLSKDEPNPAFEVTYSKNAKAGTANVTVRATANSVYTGSKTASFKIAPAELNDVVDREVLDESIRAVLAKSPKIYTGKALTFTKQEIGEFVLKDSSDVIIPHTGFKFTYSNNVNAGNGILHITGTGNYAGTIKQTFRIEPKSILDLKVTGPARVTVPEDWDNTPVRPVITVRSGIISSLTEGKDYVVTYTNNTRIGVARATVRAIGNYSGSKVFYFRITY